MHLKSHVDIAVLVVDKNDHSPRPSNGPMQRVNVSEGSDKGTVVTQIEAIDPDLGPGLTYSIIKGDPQSYFAIDSETGLVTLQGRRLDRETFPQVGVICKSNDLFRSQCNQSTAHDHHPNHGSGRAAPEHRRPTDH